MFTVISAFKPSPTFKLHPTLIETTPKFCIDCKFYIKPDFFLISNEFGECSLFVKEQSNDHFLVNGINNNDDKEYYHCSTARKWEDMCGREGKLYEKK